MKNTSLLILIMTLSFNFMGCQPNQNLSEMKDLTKEEIIPIFEKHSGETIRNADDFCVEKASSFNGVYSLGWFAHDRGCMGDEILVGKEIGLRKNLTAKALELNGWKDKSKQQALALAWTKEVILAWESALTSTDEDFEKEDTPTFEAPKAIENGDGWTVTTWVRRPSGMLPQASYYQLKVDFDANGNISDQKQVNSFVVEFN